MQVTTRIIQASLVAIGVFAVIGCCGESTGTASASSAETEEVKIEASCDAIEGMSVCMDYATKAAANAGCGSFEGKVKDGACPAADRVVACKLKDGNIRNYYKSGGSPHELAYAKGHCKNAMGGKEVTK